MEIGSRVVDDRGRMGIILGFRQHPYQKEVQEAQVEYDEPTSYPFCAVKLLHELNGEEPLVDVLNELYQKAFKAYEDYGYGGNEYAQNAYSNQLQVLKTIAARVLNSSLPKE